MLELSIIFYQLENEFSKTVSPLSVVFFKVMVDRGADNRFSLDFCIAHLDVGLMDTGNVEKVNDIIIGQFWF